jgi:hypothetical protein
MDITSSWYLPFSNVSIACNKQLCIFVEPGPWEIDIDDITSTLGDDRNQITNQNWKYTKFVSGLTQYNMLIDARSRGLMVLQVWCEDLYRW